MPKETTKKKNPLLDEEETSTEEETTDEETADEAGDDEVESSTGKTAAPKKAAAKPAAEVVAAPRINAVAALNSDIVRTKKVLEKDPKVSFFIPLGIGEKPGATEDVWINGAKWTVKKGVMTQVPQTVANILAEHYQITSEAGSAYRTDLDERKENALS